MLRVYFYAAAVVAIVAVLAGVYHHIYSSGKASVETAIVNTEIKNARASNEIKNAVAGRTASSNRAGLRVWSRP